MIFSSMDFWKYSLSFEQCNFLLKLHYFETTQLEENSIAQNHIKLHGHFLCRKNRVAQGPPVHNHKNSRLDLKKFFLALLSLEMCHISPSIVQFMVSNWNGFTLWFYVGQFMVSN